MSDPIIVSVEEVLKIHEALVEEFARSNDPIYPPGIKSLCLLESAVGRQMTGIGGTLKYPDPVENAATLVYGICCDHPFHNGNKRTALVSMLVHLDKNHLCLYNTGQKDLYNLLLAIASHNWGGKPDPRKSYKVETKRLKSDEEVIAIKDWLEKRVDKVRRGERPITYREMRKIISRFDYVIDVGPRNTADVYKLEKELRTFYRRQEKIVRNKVGTIGYRDEGTVMSFKDIKDLRRMCLLTEEDGIDHDAFYNDDTIIDTYVNHYRTLLRRLARV